LHLHGGGYAGFMRNAPGAIRVLLRHVLGRAARVIVLGESLRSMLGDAVAADRVVVIPNGIADSGRARVDRGEGRMRILYLGNLIPTKGYTDLIEAVQLLLDEGLDVDVTFAGGVADSG